MWSTRFVCRVRGSCLSPLLNRQASSVQLAPVLYVQPNLPTNYWCYSPPWLKGYLLSSSLKWERESRTLYLVMKRLEAANVHDFFIIAAIDLYSSIVRVNLDYFIWSFCRGIHFRFNFIFVHILYIVSHFVNTQLHIFLIVLRNSMMGRKSKFAVPKIC